MLEEVDNIQGRNLVEVKGIDLSAKDDENRIDDLTLIKVFYQIFIPLFLKTENLYIFQV